MTAPPGRQTLAGWPVGAAYMPPRPAPAKRRILYVPPGANSTCFIIYYLFIICSIRGMIYLNPNIYHKKERSILTTNEKIAALRAAAKAAGADGVLIMTSDPHCSEYLPGYYNALPWVFRLHRRELDPRCDSRPQRPVVRWPLLRAGRQAAGRQRDRVHARGLRGRAHRGRVP